MRGMTVEQLIEVLSEYPDYWQTNVELVKPAGLGLLVR